MIRPYGTNLECVDGMLPIVFGTGRAGEVQDVVHGAFNLNGLGDIMLNKRKVLMIHQVCDIRRPAGQQVVQA
jgi:hypothetical protein